MNKKREDFEGMTKFNFSGILHKVHPSTLAGHIVSDCHSPTYVVVIADANHSDNKLAYYTDDYTALLKMAIYWDSFRPMSDGVIKAYETLRSSGPNSYINDISAKVHKDVLNAVKIQESGK